MRLCVMVAFLWTCATSAQLEVIQYSAEFVKENEISLKAFKAYDAKTLYMSKASSAFREKKIKYIPTVVLYYNDEEVLRVESGISLKLPENSIKQIEEKIEEIIESKF